MGSYFVKLICKCPRLNLILIYYSLNTVAMCTIGYFRAMSGVIIGNVVKVLVAIVKVRHACFSSILCSAT